MDINVVASVMRHEAKVNTLEAVNIHLLKTSHDQKEQQVMQLIESVIPVESTGNKGKHINTQV